MKNVTKTNEGHTNDVLSFTLNGVRYEWTQEYITGAELRRVGNIPEVEDIFLAIKKPWEDEPVPDEKTVNLARPEIEHFYSKNKEQKLVLIVNGTPKDWDNKTISFEQLVVLAFGSYDPNPGKVYTVTYDRGPRENPEGTMVKGDIVFVKNKMIFNVTCTDKS
jgi:hypothetical protein